jgi:hypothetical protein
MTCSYKLYKSVHVDCPIIKNKDTSKKIACNILEVTKVDRKETMVYIRLLPKNFLTSTSLLFIPGK